MESSETLSARKLLEDLIRDTRIAGMAGMYSLNMIARIEEARKSVSPPSDISEQVRKTVFELASIITGEGVRVTREMNYHRNSVISNLDQVIELGRKYNVDTSGQIAKTVSEISTIMAEEITKITQERGYNSNDVTKVLGDVRELGKRYDVDVSEKVEKTVKGIAHIITDGAVQLNPDELVPAYYENSVSKKLDVIREIGKRYSIDVSKDLDSAVSRISDVITAGCVRRIGYDVLFMKSSLTQIIELGRRYSVDVSDDINRAVSNITAAAVSEAVKKSKESYNPHGVSIYLNTVISLGSYFNVSVQKHVETGVLEICDVVLEPVYNFKKRISPKMVLKRGQQMRELGERYGIDTASRVKDAFSNRIKWLERLKVDAKEVIDEEYSGSRKALVQALPRSFTYSTIGRVLLDNIFGRDGYRGNVDEGAISRQIADLKLLVSNL